MLILALNLKKRLFKLFDNQYGVVLQYHLKNIEDLRKCTVRWLS